MRNEHSFTSSSSTRLLTFALLALIFVGLLAASFVGSGVKVAPRDVPVAVTGGEAAAAAIASRLDEQLPGGFDVRSAADATEARHMVLDREVYGAFVTRGPQVEEVLVASAASPAVAQLLGQLATQVGTASVTDVAAAPAEDPRGAGLAGGALPITIAGILAGMLLVFLVSSRWAQVGGALVLGGSFGAVLLGVIRGAYSALDGSVVAEWLAISAGVSAIAVLLVGVHRASGRVGLVLTELTLVVLGNPWTGVTSAPELLPQPWSSIGHWMPLGATVDLLRGLSGFGGAAIGDAVVALAGWAVLGLVLLAVGRTAPRRRDAESSPGVDPEVVAGSAG